MDWDNKSQVLDIMKLEFDGVNILRKVSERLRDDEEVLRAAINREAYQYQWASKRLKNNPAIALEVMKKSGNCLFLSGEIPQDDPAVVWEAVFSESGRICFLFASERLKNDAKFILSLLVEDKLNWGDGKEIIKCSSDRIKWLIGDNDPIEALKTIIEKERIESALNAQEIAPMKGRNKGLRI